MKLSQYLYEHRVSKREFGALLGVTGEAVRLWTKDVRLPRRDVMRRISVITDGAVTPMDFFDFDDEATQ